MPGTSIIMRISEKRKAICTILLLMSAAATCSADEKVAVASIDKNIYRPQASRAFPPVVKETYEYYEIKGNTEDQLRSEMCRNGCKWKDGRTYDSVTNWHVKWDYDYDRSAQTCSADSFRASVDITFRYPKWVRTDDASGPLAAKWDAYMKNLVEHENGHRDMAVEAAAELSRAVADLPPAPTCAELDRAVRSLCHERLNRLNADAKEYDEATRHGTVQGAVFP
jgi:predicted secreted Zn-dependent protease